MQYQYALRVKMINYANIFRAAIGPLTVMLLLTLFVEAANLPKVPAQALAVAASMPFNFIGNKLWTFRSEADADLAART